MQLSGFLMPEAQHFSRRTYCSWLRVSKYCWSKAWAMQLLGWAAWMSMMVAQVYWMVWVSTAWFLEELQPITIECLERFIIFLKFIK